jgi:hypothetical protein
MIKWEERLPTMLSSLRENKFACDVYPCVPDGRAQNRDTAANPQSRISGDPAGRGEAPLARFGFSSRLVSSLAHQHNQRSSLSGHAQTFGPARRLVMTPNANSMAQGYASVVGAAGSWTHQKTLPLHHHFLPQPTKSTLFSSRPLFTTSRRRFVSPCSIPPS